MNCPNCTSNNTIVIYTEVIPCNCGEKMILDHHNCDHCFSTWKTVNGIFLEDSLTKFDDFDFFCSKNTTEVVSEFTTLGGFIHKCLKCHSLVYQSKPGHFYCSNCGFSWEVYDCD